MNIWRFIYIFIFIYIINWIIINIINNINKKLIKLLDNFLFNDILDLNINNQKSDKIISKKELNPFFKNNINKANSGYINKSSFTSKKEEDKINSNKNDLIIQKTNFRIKTISNEAYLKQILGNKYRDQDDEFISYAEKKLMKTINDYNSNLAKITKMKLRFKKKMKKNKW